MAIRSVLHINYKDDFIEFLESEGFVIQDVKGDYEVIRAKNGRRTVIVFKKSNAKEHLSVMDKDQDLISRYFRKARKIR